MYNFMQRLRFGTAGIPLTTPDPNTINGIKYLRELGLESMELEFVRSVNISEQKAPLIKAVAQEHNIALTCHGSYYINLNAAEKAKLEASQQRIYQSARIADLCGARSLTFHAAYYLNQTPELVYQKVKAGLKEVLRKLQEGGHTILVRPETTGKAAQWGSLKEIIRLAQELEQVLPCIDFSHIYARSVGKNNTSEEFRELLSLVEAGLGRAALDNMHIHLSGIHYSDKGERYHLNLSDSQFNYQDLLKVWKEFKIKGTVVCESPNIEQDALLLQKHWHRPK